MCVRICVFVCEVVCKCICVYVCMCVCRCVMRRRSARSRGREQRADSGVEMIQCDQSSQEAHFAGQAATESRIAVEISEQSSSGQH